jgi:hypothetical protein
MHPVTLVGETEPRGLVQPRDLMVCSAGAAASHGVHGSAAVAARNLQPGLAPRAGCSRSIMGFVQLSQELLPLTEGPNCNRGS